VKVSLRPGVYISSMKTLKLNSHGKDLIKNFHHAGNAGGTRLW
jgi:hypothetical protein